MKSEFDNKDCVELPTARAAENLGQASAENSGTACSDCGAESQGSRKAACFTAAELKGLDLKDLPQEMVSAKHLIYSSPATLAYNSPGAEGFGVKRAGLSVPESVMLIVSPGCCGRNTSLISSMPAYKNRFFYLTLDDNDIVTGKHLKRIPQAVAEIVEHLEHLAEEENAAEGTAKESSGCHGRPKLVMICITCVDALLGTDMERVCRKAEEAAGVLVRPCYMYALTREGRRPPMVHVRQSIYSLLQPSTRKGNVVNYLGFFAPLRRDFELTNYLKIAGVKTIHEIGSCKTYEEFLEMSEANFNIVLNPEARYAAQDFQKNLKIPSVEIKRFYDPERIHKQYKALQRAIGIRIDDHTDYIIAQEAIEHFKSQVNYYYKPTGKDGDGAKEVPVNAFGDKIISVAIGECLNADSFELALALTLMGMKVKAIYGTVSDENQVYLNKLADLSPDTKVYSNMEPTMIYYGSGVDEVDITLGKDAGYYHPDVPNVAFNTDEQPFGYAAVKLLLNEMETALGI